MSGGSMNYFCYTLEEHENRLGDRELNDLVHDLVKVFHDKEWADSGDICDGAYNKTVMEFKQKWFTNDGRNERHDKYIKEAVEGLRNDLMIVNSFCFQCKYWGKSERYDEYGDCEFQKTCLIHEYERPCERFEVKERC